MNNQAPVVLSEKIIDELGQELWNGCNEIFFDSTRWQRPLPWADTPESVKESQRILAKKIAIKTLEIFNYEYETKK